MLTGFWSRPTPHVGLRQTWFAYFRRPSCISSVSRLNVTSHVRARRAAPRRTVQKTAFSNLGRCVTLPRGTFGMISCSTGLLLFFFNVDGRLFPVELRGRDFAERWRLSSRGVRVSESFVLCNQITKWRGVTFQTIYLLAAVVGFHTQYRKKKNEVAIIKA